MLGAALLPHAPWGVNVPLWLVASAALTWLVTNPGQALMRRVVWLSAIPVVAFSLAFAWRDSDDLKILNGLMLFFAFGAMALESHRATVTARGNYLLRLFAVWYRFVEEFARLLTKGVAEHKESRAYLRLGGVLRGILIAAPALALFGALFASADPMFLDWLRRCVQFDPMTLFCSVFTFCVVTPLVGGLTAQVLLPAEPPKLTEPLPTVHAADLPQPAPRQPVVGAVEIVTALVLVDALFLAFVAVQARYFFGGAGRVHTVAGLTFADYARSGFYELTCVAALAVPWILGAKSLIRPAGPTLRKAFTIGSAVLLGCVAIVLVSAIERMRLYVDAYGLTELQFYTGIFMLWLSGAVALATWVVLARSQKTFLRSALYLAYGVAVAANFVNPDATIARRDLALGAKTDVAYLSELSLDAAPTIVSGIDKLPVKDRERLRAALSKNWRLTEDDLDWRSTNLSRVKYQSEIRRALFPSR